MYLIQIDSWSIFKFVIKLCTHFLPAFAEGTPYVGGEFKLKLVLGKDFPAAPPKGYFLTKVSVDLEREIWICTLQIVDAW